APLSLCMHALVTVMQPCKSPSLAQKPALCAIQWRANSPSVGVAIIIMTFACEMNTLHHRATYRAATRSFVLLPMLDGDVTRPPNYRSAFWLVRHRYRHHVQGIMGAI